MLIETTYMKFGSSPGGLVGVTLKPKSVIRWAYCFHKISTMTKELKEITDTSNREGKHKEEYKGRMKSDLEDRMKIRKKLSGCIIPLTETEDEFSDGIVNIATGKVTASSQTNVHNLKQIGDLQLKVFRASLPCGFHQPISSGVTTAAKKVKKLKSADGNRETKDIGAIFNRLLLMSSVSGTPIDMKEVLKYELTPMPLSMFKTNGSPRICKAKSDFMNGLKVTVPTRGKTPDMTIVDGCAVRWKIQWPSADGTVQDFVKGFHKFVTRENRNVIQSSKRVKITLTGPAHDKNVVLANKDNKIQLIRILVESLKTLQLQGRESERKLILTGLDPIPFEVCRGNVRDRLDLKNLQDHCCTDALNGK